MMERSQYRNWRELSRAASQEQDPEKLLQLVHELNESLQREEESHSNSERDF